MEYIDAYTTYTLGSMNRRKILTKSFLSRPTLFVARELIGKYLIRRVNGKTIALPITEVEAYDGFRDRASHAFRGRTVRNAVMFGGAGHWYVYFCYGVHWMLNIVTGPKDYPAAILIRGAGDLRGPGRLTKALKIGGALTGKPLGAKSSLWIEDRGLKISKREIKRMARIGVTSAGPIWSAKLYRFVLEKK